MNNQTTFQMTTNRTGTDDKSTPEDRAAAISLAAQQYGVDQSTMAAKPGSQPAPGGGIPAKKMVTQGSMV